MQYGTDILFDCFASAENNYGYGGDSERYVDME